MTVPPDLVAQLDAALVRRLVGHLALARKAGGAVAGYEKVRDWLMSGRAAVLVQAADGSERGRAKLRPPPAGDDGKTTLIDCLNAGEIGLAFGREHVIHAALAAGGLGARALEDAARLAGIRGRIGAIAAGKE
ncbi:MAG: hypothetical protein H5U20_04475 [Rhodobacteraceae bacterium]|nr:hypothetical protein [Paracoccaceae bacterium]